jgi:hypothetical protein
MRPYAAALLVAGTLLTTGTARADAPTGVGSLCGFASSDDRTGAVGQPGQQIGEVYGGPVAVADLPASLDPVFWDEFGNPASGTITCAIQVGGTGAYADADGASASASGTVVVYLPPTEITYFNFAAPPDPVWLCTTWTLTDGHGDTDTLYHDYSTGRWTTDPYAAQCAFADHVGNAYFLHR